MFEKQAPLARRWVLGASILAAFACLGVEGSAHAATQHAAFSPLADNAVVAFVAGHEPSAVTSLDKHLSNIDVAVPDWFALTGNGCGVAEHADEPVRRTLADSELTVIPRLATHLLPDAPRGASRFPKEPATRACLVDRLTQRLLEIQAAGLDVQLDGIAGAPREAAEAHRFLSALHDALHARGLRLTVDLPLNAKAVTSIPLAEVADAVLLVASAEAPVPAKPVGAAVAPFDAALGEQLDAISRKVPADRLAVVFDTAGHDAAAGGSLEELSFRGAMARAASAGSLPSFDERTNAQRFSYRVGSGRTHEVSFSDALSVWNGAAAVRKHGVKRIGVRRLGEEDPSLWAFLGAGTPAAPAALAQLPPLDSVRVLEEGEVYSVRERPRGGQRRVDVLPDGRVSGAYLTLPTGYEVDGLRAAGKELALTFDDGPDERNTGHLLDVLRELRVPAAFFVVGEQALQSRELVKREAAEGHLIGMHSFTHPHFQALAPIEAKEEIESTRELLVSLTGSRSVLFRAPYEPFLRLGRASDRAILDTAVRNDCSYIGGFVNADDWQRKSADVIATQVVADVVSGVGKVIVLHDGGGDRSETVAAVRELVPELRRQGYEFVGLDRLFRHRLADVPGPVTRAP